MKTVVGEGPLSAEGIRGSFEVSRAGRVYLCGVLGAGRAGSLGAGKVGAAPQRPVRVHGHSFTLVEVSQEESRVLRGYRDSNAATNIRNHRMRSKTGFAQIQKGWISSQCRLRSSSAFRFFFIDASKARFSNGVSPLLMIFSGFSF